MRGENILKLLTPGPVEVPERVLRKCCQKVISHRSQDFRELLTNIVEKLKKLVKLDEDGAIAILSGSGTTAVDAMIWSFVKPKDKVLAIVNGDFGKRAADSAIRRGAHVETIYAEEGNVVDVETIANKLETKNYNFVIIVQNETSMAVRYTFEELKRIGETAQANNALVLVDAVSGLAGDKVWFTDGIAAIASCTHKAIATPPGAAFVAISPEGLELLKKRYSTDVPPILDLKRYVDKYDTTHETPFTPPVTILYALEEALRIIVDEIGIEKYIEIHVQRKHYFYDKIKYIDKIKPVPQNMKVASNTLVALWIENAILIQQALKKAGYLVATGIKEYKNKMIRIGLMGDINFDDLDTVIQVLEYTLGSK